MSINMWPTLPSSYAVPDVYYTEAFLMLGACIEGGYPEPVVLEYLDATGSIHLPCLLRKIDDTEYRDITSPYGYGGPIINGAPDIERFVREFYRWAIDKSVVSAFIRFDPIRENFRPFSDHTTLVSNVVLVPTGAATDVLLNLTAKYRKQYRRSSRAGMRTQISSSLTTASIDDFRALYEESMVRVGAQGRYYFGDSFWQTIDERQSELGASISRTTLDGVVHATALRFSHGKYAYNFLSATSNPGRHSHATEFDKVNYCLYAQQHGRELVNFGGGLGGVTDTLLEHKRRFAPDNELGEYHVARLVFMPDVYRYLSASESIDQGYFPAYRFKG